jgi:hypothetical protein
MVFHNLTRIQGYADRCRNLQKFCPPERGRQNQFDLPRALLRLASNPMEAHLVNKVVRVSACIVGLLITQLTGHAADAKAAASAETETKPAETVKSETATAVPASADTNFDVVANSVVKIFTTTRYPDLFHPWTKASPSEHGQRCGD